MLLALFPGPYTQHLGLALSMLIGNVLSVSILQWAVMPVLNTLFAPWLLASSTQHRGASLAGASLIVALLAGLVLLFRQILG
jgi:antibiotic biosynthesis monooxygenase (ABM) superfamily enzyme